MDKPRRITVEDCITRAAELGMSYGAYMSSEQYINDTTFGGYFDEKNIESKRKKTRKEKRAENGQA